MPCESDRVRCLLLLWVLLVLGGCSLQGAAGPGGEPEASPDITALSAQADTGGAWQSDAASREGPGGYQRTTVPPGFLVLMLGVPLVLLLLLVLAAVDQSW